METPSKSATPPGGHDHHEHGHDHDHGGATELHTYIGVALVLGFLFMLLIDQLSGKGGHSHVSLTGEKLYTGPPLRPFLSTKTFLVKVLIFKK
jgi:hypothetical protein